MKLFKIILGAALCLSTVNCKIHFSKDGEIIDDPCKTPTGTDRTMDLQVCDLESAPTKIEYFHGGWYGYGTLPNHRLSLTLTRRGIGVSGHAESPTCKIDGVVDINEFLALDQLSTDVKTVIQEDNIIDAGDESLAISDDDGTEKIFLRTSDGGYKKPLVRDQTDADAIRKQVNKIADALLANCEIDDPIVRVVLTERIDTKTFVADKDATLPHKKFDLTVQDIRIQLSGATDSSINGYRIVTKPTERCTTKISSAVSDFAEWRKSAALITFDHSSPTCAVGQGASQEDWRIVFPQNPKRLSVSKLSGTSDSGLFGCQYSDRVSGSESFEVLVNAALTANGTTTCVKLPPVSPTQ